MDSADNPLFLIEGHQNPCHLTEYLSTIYESETFKSDVVLVCAGNSHQQLKAHRSVLAAASPFFYHLLKDVQDDEIYLSLDGYEALLVKKFLQLLYTGSTTIHKNKEASFAGLLGDFEVGDSLIVVIVDKDPDPTYILQEENVDVEMEESELSVPKKSNDTTFKCKYCGQVLNTRTGLRLHLLVHKGSKQFTCDICGKGFSQGSQLKTHLRVHTGEKPYKCDVCDKSFSHASTLSEHKNLHTADKPFQCNVCQQSFAQRKALRVHRCEEDTADKIKTFSCPFCSRSFTTRRGLGIHKMHQHVEASNEPLLQCDKVDCNQTFTSELAYEEHLACHFEF